MSVTYEQAPEAEVGAMVARVMAEHHKHLHALGVTIETLFARKLDKEGEPAAAIVVRGQVCGAKISITSLQDRARGIADAKLIIDAEYGWERLPKDQRIAMIDRELCHLTIATDKDGEPKHDDHGRPKLKYRHFDYEISGFTSCLENYGEASIEAKQIRLFQELNGQYCLFQTPASLEVHLATSAK